jgi:GntR family transcriptional regulator
MSSTGGRSSPLRTTIDRSSPIPYYVQLKEALREHVEAGAWHSGDVIPGEPELCRLFGVSRTVVRQALKELTYEGLVVREKGKGTFVAEPKIGESLVQELTGFYQDMVDRGLKPRTRVLKQEVVPASRKVADHLRVQPETPVVQIDRLRFVEDEPIVLVTTYLPEALCAQLLQADLSQQSLYAFLESHCGIKIAFGRRTIEAVPASEYEARLLEVDKGAPLLTLDSVSYLEDGTPIEYFHALHRGDRSRFEVELLRVPEGSDAKQALRQIPDVLPRGNDLITPPTADRGERRAW